MNRENMQAWIVDLRTTDAKQGKFALHRIEPQGDRFCCMGRACQVALLHGVDIDVKTQADDEPFVTYDDHEAYLPTSVRDWLGIDGDLSYDCARWNDSQGGMSFAKIAGRLEKLLEHDVEDAS